MKLSISARCGNDESTFYTNERHSINFENGLFTITNLLGAAVCVFPTNVCWFTIDSSEEVQVLSIAPKTTTIKQNKITKKK